MRIEDLIEGLAVVEFWGLALLAMACLAWVVGRCAPKSWARRIDRMIWR